MRKTIATIGGAAALLALAIPAFGFYQMPVMTQPDRNINRVRVEESVRTFADTGDNVVTVTGQTQQAPSPCGFGPCSWS